MKKIITILVIFFMVFGLAACKHEEDAPKEITSVRINTKQSQIKLGGDDLQLNAVAIPSGIATTFRWESSDPSVATVDQNGKVHGVSLGNVVITAYAENNVYGTKRIQVKDEIDEEFPDLQGYTIRIAHSNLREYNPFYDDGEGHIYEGLDIAEAQAAIEAVESDYNCKIEFVEYPSDAAWGATRWDYIINQAINKKTEFDICVVTDAYIPRMVSGGALYNMSDWYDKYGQDFMDYAYIKSGTYKGRLYSLTSSRSDVYNILGVNLGLLERIQQYDETIKEPATMFLEDNWSFDSFYAWCKKVQNVLDSHFSNEESKYYTLSGYSSYYWQGMVNASGVVVADTTTYKANLLGDIETEAANLVRKFVEEGIEDSANQVDGSVMSWNNGQAVINTGEFWFVNAATRWGSTLWGEGEATRFGYAPYPSKTGTKEDYKLGVFGGQTWVMPVGKTNYADYGEECTAENIYRILMDYLQRKERAYKNNESYDPELEQRTINGKAFSSNDSIAAISWLNIHSTDINFYDPMNYEGNQVANLYDSDFAKATLSFFAGDIATWAEAVTPFEEPISKQILTIYG